MLPWIVGLVCLLANVVAILAIAGGRRSSRPRRYAARSGIAAVAVILTVGIGYVGMMAGAFSDVAGTDPSRKATVLARGISEAMNTLAFGLLAFVLPLGASIYLLIVRPGGAGRD